MKGTPRMMKTSITKRFSFEAAHELPFHDGKCKNLHGHSYKVEVTVRGPVQGLDKDNPESGMVVDFKALTNFWKERLEPLLDHQQISGLYPTAENLAMFIYDVYETELSSQTYFRVAVERVKVWETEDSSAQVEVV